MEVLNYFLKFLVLFATLFEIVLAKAQMLQTLDETKYIIEVDYKYNWIQASHHCARFGYQLAIIDLPEKNNDLIELLNSTFAGKYYNLWLGGSDLLFTTQKQNRPFYWSASGNQFEYTHWAPNNPDNAQDKEHCVHIWKDSKEYRWNDNECDNTFIGFICEESLFSQYCHDMVGELVDILPCA